MLYTIRFLSPPQKKNFLFFFYRRADEMKAAPPREQTNANHTYADMEKKRIFFAFLPHIMKRKEDLFSPSIHNVTVSSNTNVHIEVSWS